MYSDETSMTDEFGSAMAYVKYGVNILMEF
jgi:hypothetical protein